MGVHGGGTDGDNRCHRLEVPRMNVDFMAGFWGGFGVGVFVFIFIYFMTRFIELFKSMTN